MTSHSIPTLILCAALFGWASCQPLPGLTSLSVDGIASSQVTLSPAFDPTTLAYTLTAPYGIGTIHLLAGPVVTGPTTGPAIITIKISGTVLGSIQGTGGNSPAIPLPVNVPVIITLSISAPESLDAPLVTYVITATQLPVGTGNAQLSSLSAYGVPVAADGSQLSLTPAFDPATLAYTLSVPNGISTIHVQAGPVINAPAAAAIAVKIWDITLGSIESTGGNSPAIPLPVKVPVVISLALSGPDFLGAPGTPLTTYTITAMQEGSTNAQLASLSVPGAILTPAFVTGGTTYSITVPVGGFSTFSVLATAEDPMATVTIMITPPNGVSAPFNPAGQVVLPGSVVTITVTASDQVTAKTYTVSCQPAQPITCAACLKGLALVISGQRKSLEPVFTPLSTAYEAGVVRPTVTKAVVWLMAENPTSTVSVNGQPLVLVQGAGSIEVALAYGVNTISVLVTSGGGEVKGYTIAVTRGQSSSLPIVTSRR